MSKVCTHDTAGYVSSQLVEQINAAPLERWLSGLFLNLNRTSCFVSYHVAMCLYGAFSFSLAVSVRHTLSLAELGLFDLFHSDLWLL